MRILILILALAAIAPARAQQPSASEDLKGKFLAILQQQVAGMIDEAPTRAVPPPKPEEVVQQIKTIMTEVKTSYGPVITLSEADAHQILTVGPDNKTNLAAMQRDIALWKKVDRPMPVIYQRMQAEVTSGKIKDGLELELTRRIADFHLHQLGLL